MPTDWVVLLINLAGLVLAAVEDRSDPAAPGRPMRIAVMVVCGLAAGAALASILGGSKGQ